MRFPRSIGSPFRRMIPAGEVSRTAVWIEADIQGPGTLLPQFGHQLLKVNLFLLDVFNLLGAGNLPLDG